MLKAERVKVEREPSPAPATWDRTVQDDNARVTSSVSGASGDLRVESAEIGHVDTFRVQALFGAYSGTGFPAQNQRDDLQQGTFTLAYVPHPNVETFISFGLSSNFNEATVPHLLQSQGDLGLGVKGVWPVAEGFAAGASARLLLMPGVGESTVGAAGFDGRLLASYDFRPALSFPLRAHFNLGFVADQTSSFYDIDGGLSYAEEFALGAHRWDRMPLGLALDAPLPVATPFLEFRYIPLVNVSYPLLEDRYGIPANALTDDVLGVGAKVTALRDFTFTLAGEFGLQRWIVPGNPIAPPWAVLASVTYNVDVMAKRQTRVVERDYETEKKILVAPPPPATGKAEGVVLDAETKSPLPGAVIAMSPMAGKEPLPPVASDAPSGRFVTYDLPPGKVQLVASKDGYKVASVDVEIAAGKSVPAQLWLERSAKPALLKLTVKSAGRKPQPLDATVTLDGPRPQQLTTTSGSAEVTVPRGRYAVKVAAQGYLAKQKDLDLGEGVTTVTDFELSPEPKQSFIVIQKDKITLKKQIHFAFNKAKIFPDSYPVLDEVQDALIKKGVKRVRIEGHTDNVGTAGKNMKLSQDRADAVRDYLIKQGISPDRLEARGYGSTRPIAPNVTNRGREMNRRVEFVILDQ